MKKLGLLAAMIFVLTSIGIAGVTELKEGKWEFVFRRGSYQSLSGLEEVNKRIDGLNNKLGASISYINSPSPLTFNLSLRLSPLPQWRIGLNFDYWQRQYKSSMIALPKNYVEMNPSMTAISLGAERKLVLLREPKILSFFGVGAGYCKLNIQGDWKNEIESVSPSGFTRTEIKTVGNVARFESYISIALANVGINYSLDSCLGLEIGASYFATGTIKEQFCSQWRDVNGNWSSEESPITVEMKGVNVYMGTTLKF